MEVTALTRIFKFAGITFLDPGIGFAPDQVREFYAGVYPDITNAEIEGPKIAGNTQEWTFRRAVGTKGALDVARNPRTASSEVVWYDARETTPFAIHGSTGFIIAALQPELWGDEPYVLFFGDDGYEWPDGSPIENSEEEVIAFAFMPARPSFA